MTANTPVLVYLHIPKTAGTSFSKIVMENVGETYLYRGLREYIKTTLPENAVIRGHMPYGIHHYTRKPVRYFTLLRDPVEQCISYYYFSRCWLGQPDYADATKYDLGSFYKMRHHQNMQTHHIGGYLPARISSYVPGAIRLWNAKRRLEEKVIFGLVERYEESVQYLCDTFAWKNRPIIHSRHAKGRPLLTDVPPAVIEELRFYNKLDVQLYKYACELFNRRLSGKDRPLVDDSLG